MGIILLKAAIFRHRVGILGINLPRSRFFLFICDLKAEYEAVTIFSLLLYTTGCSRLRACLFQESGCQFKTRGKVKCKRQGCLLCFLTPSNIRDSFRPSDLSHQYKFCNYENHKSTLLWHLCC